MPGIRVPSWPRLIERVMRDAPYAASDCHGDRHWRAVAVAGLLLADRTPGADREAVLAFALIHDHVRRTDGEEPDHGARAARRLSGFVRDGLLAGAPEDLERLGRAIADHSEGMLDRDPTVACCWDADRLNLWRVGTRPDPDRMSTAAARDDAVLDWSMSLHATAPGWYALLDDGFDPLSVGGRDPDWVEGEDPYAHGGWGGWDDGYDDGLGEDAEGGWSPGIY